MKTACAPTWTKTAPVAATMHDPDSRYCGIHADLEDAH